MVTNNIKVVCPKCKLVNCYEITKMTLVDTDLHVSYSCEACKTEYIDIYMLVYLGGNVGTMKYDRDNITVAL